MDLILGPVCLAGRQAAPWLLPEGSYERWEGWTLQRAGERFAGWVLSEPVSGERLRECTRELYAQLFEWVGARPLWRLWHFVPQINAEAEGLENYRHFCRGRSEAFEARYGAAAQAHMPAASAVGASDGCLRIAFLGGPGELRHHENPRQVPAYQYPEIHGPRPPSFARATEVRGVGERRIFVSGTASIRGHESQGHGSLEAQLEETRLNLASLAAQLDLPADFTVPGARPQFQVYLRDPATAPQVQDWLRRTYDVGDEAVSLLHAEICRRELDVEIELALQRR